MVENRRESGSMAKAGEPKVFGFCLLPKFAMLAFTAAVEPLRAAHRLSGRTR
jgi:transcriptional regulator GlxA family with amidase domain